MSDSFDAVELGKHVADKYVPPVQVTSASKAIVGAIVAGVTGAVTAGGTALVTALSDNVITGGEWVTVVIALVTGAGLPAILTGQSVYATTNKPIG